MIKSTEKSEGSPPIEVDLTIKKGFASFTNAKHPGNRIGYRFFEHMPMIWGAVPASLPAGPEPPFSWPWETGNADQESAPPSVYRRDIAEDEDGWTEQSWTYLMQPVDDGIEMVWAVETTALGLPAYYGVQQCFRMTGRTNEAWKRKLALTPAFSEFDLWHDEGREPPVSTLSHVVRGACWQPLPATRESVGAATACGCRIDRERFTGKSPDTIGTYRARSLDPVDCGLITRTDLAGEWVSAIYWEGTSHVTVHHPADCLHAIVNIGGVPPRSRREIRGKIYWFKGSKDDLLERWRRDFGGDKGR
jgi:hypothetical protein